MATSFLPWEYVGKNTVRVATGATPNPKKMTGSRLGAILGLNKWKSPFEAWCEICRVGELPFVENKFTVAGNVIEPKLIEWCRENVSPYVYSPEEYFGVADAKRYTGYDFYDSPRFGGMWDAVVLDAPLGRGEVIGLVEAKTSQRPQDWLDGVPHSYAVQGLEYAHLSGADRVFFPVAFLKPEDYENPEAFECTDTNTFLYELGIDYPIWEGLTIEDALDYADQWWDTHVLGNISPEFSETKDKEILAVLRKNVVEKNDDIETLAAEALALENEIAVIRERTDLTALEKSLDGLKKQIKSAMIPLFTDTDDVVSTAGWKVKRSVTLKIDKDALKRDGLLEKYSDPQESYTLTKEK